MAGFNLPEMAVAQQHFMNVLKSGGDEWTRLAKAFGAIDDNVALARASGVVNPDAGGITKGLTKSYENVDNAAKVAMFKWRIQKGASPEDAARFVNRALPNIGNSGEIYSFFSRLPVIGVPFRAIQPEVLRSVSSSAARNTLPFLCNGDLHYPSEYELGKRTRRRTQTDSRAFWSWSNTFRWHQ